MNNKNIVTGLAIAISLSLVASSAYATGGSMPWETPLGSLASSITGPVAKAVSVMLVAGTFIAASVGEMGSGMKKLIWICFCLSAAFASASWFLPFLGFSGGASF